MNRIAKGPFSMPGELKGARTRCVRPARRSLTTLPPPRSLLLICAAGVL
jgi:hypothetical protein